MSIEVGIIAVLSCLLIAQNIYWAKVCLNLTNRLMSRNYVEFKQAETKRTELKPKIVQDEYFDPVADRQAQDLNSILGIV